MLILTPLKIIDHSKVKDKDFITRIYQDWHTKTKQKNQHHRVLYDFFSYYDIYVNVNRNILLKWNVTIYQNYDILGLLRFKFKNHKSRIIAEFAAFKIAFVKLESKLNNLEMIDYYNKLEIEMCGA